VIDAWMQHPGQRWLDDEMFASLRRWKPGPFSETAQPVEATLEMMDGAGVGRGLLCAWWGPSGAMISNDEVAALCAAHPHRFVGLASAT
jgi:predicted TIM-barrel fold metal-dependent hydrolase